MGDVLSSWAQGHPLGRRSCRRVRAVPVTAGPRRLPGRRRSRRARRPPTTSQRRPGQGRPSRWVVLDAETCGRPGVPARTRPVHHFAEADRQTGPASGRGQRPPFGRSGGTRVSAQVRDGRTARRARACRARATAKIGTRPWAPRAAHIGRRTGRAPGRPAPRPPPPPPRGAGRGSAPDQASFSRSSSRTRAASALPRIAFMTCPMSAPGRLHLAVADLRGDGGVGRDGGVDGVAQGAVVGDHGQAARLDHLGRRALAGQQPVEDLAGELVVDGARVDERLHRRDLRRG